MTKTSMVIGSLSRNFIGYLLNDVRIIHIFLGGSHNFSGYTATTMEKLLACLKNYRYRFTSEKELQDGVELVLKNNSIDYEREYWLSGEDKIDFFVEGVGLECKVDKPVQSVLRQLHRYTHHEEVTSIILITNRAKHLGMPSSLNGKPVAVHSLLLGGL